MAKLEQPIYAPQSIDFLDETFQTDSEAAVLHNIEGAMLPPGGELWVPPSYHQTSGDQAVQLNAATDKLAFFFTPSIDFALDALSLYITAVGTAGNVNIALHSVSTGYEPNGRYNGNTTAADPVMTANNAPSPNVVGLFDNTGANAEAGAGYEAFRAMDGSVAANNGTRSNATPTALAPIYFILDLGEGNGIAANKFRFASYSNADANVRAFPKAFTFWGSNEAAPDPQTDADWTQLPSAGLTWTAETDPGAGASREYYATNATVYRNYRWSITDRNGSNAYVALGEVELFAAQIAEAPGDEITDLGALASGSVADTWIRLASLSEQLQRHTRVALVFSGSDGADVSLSVRRWNTAQGSMFPDGCVTKTDLGTGFWTQAEQESKPALLNIVLNSTANHVPKLMYGRKMGRYLYLPGPGNTEIQSEGASLVCDALTASVDHTNFTLYWIYGYVVDGVLTLEASTTTPACTDDTEGIEVKSTATTRRLLGAMCVKNLVSTHQGPVDVGDWRGLAWRGRELSIYKYSPFASITTQSLATTNIFQKWNTDDAYKVVFLGISGMRVKVFMSAACGSGGVAFSGILNHMPLEDFGTSNDDPRGGHVKQIDLRSTQFYSFWPTAASRLAAASLYLYAKISDGYRSLAAVIGDVK
jgi:hypothetical protein